ncbi:polysaccharide deacetylase family protein [Streptomyces sp. MAR4 CNX-425]|uniref:polysaccharide deacetylase family protein n=1 Tax=Streptomyces sp. MAR4 CNX-425 TaxID=3406343 RepID=UPI003B5004E5
MKYDKYPARGLPRRTALCLGLLGAYQLAIAPDAHTPRRPGAAGRAAAEDGKPLARAASRQRPAAGHPAARTGAAAMTTSGGMARIAGPTRPVVVRAAPHTTLRQTGKKIALTFDDGPHATQTPAILRILRRHRARATFFVIGENIPFNRDVLRRIAADGHAVGNHSYTHPQLDLISTPRVNEELERCSELVAKELGAPPRLARAPYGMWHGPSLAACARLQMEPFQWDIDTLDWDNRDQRFIETTVLGGAHPGAIVLAHDGGGNRWATVRALEYYLPRLLDEGYTLAQPA